MSAKSIKTPKPRDSSKRRESTKDTGYDSDNLEHKKSDSKYSENEEPHTSIDSEYGSESDPVEHDITFKIQSAHCSQLQLFNEF
jgi:hypothetical protein